MLEIPANSPNLDHVVDRFVTPLVQITPYRRLKLANTQNKLQSQSISAWLSTAGILMRLRRLRPLELIQC